VKNFDPSYISFACEESLRRLRTDTIDIYQLHSPPADEIRKDEVWSALERLRRQGKVRAVGASVSRIEDAKAAGEHNAQTLQFTYNLLDRDRAVELIAVAKSFGAAVIARSPLCYGLLSGRYAPGHRFGPGDTRCGRWPDEELDRRLARAGELASLARAHGFTLAQLAIAFCLSNPDVSVVIPGMKAAAHVALLAAVSGKTLPEAVRQKL
jgi:aryl-alcohol dehydrogenase-like predicted oxidoreductase